MSSATVQPTKKSFLSKAWCPILIVGAVLVNGLIGDDKTSATNEELPVASADASTSGNGPSWNTYTVGECMEGIDALSRAGVIHGAVKEPTRKHGVMVVVDGENWRLLPFHVKENIAQCLNLFIMGDSGKALRLITLLDDRTRKPIGKLDMLRYYDL